MTDFERDVIDRLARIETTTNLNQASIASLNPAVNALGNRLDRVETVSTVNAETQATTAKTLLLQGERLDNLERVHTRFKDRVWIFTITGGTVLAAIVPVIVDYIRVHVLGIKF